MSTEDEFIDFQNQMNRLKYERRSRTHWDQGDMNNLGVIERVKFVILPVVQAFVDMDRTLEMQSNTSRVIYISYANARIYGLWVSATSLDNICIEATFDSYSTRIYVGRFNEREMKSAVKHALLDWYRRII